MRFCVPTLVCLFALGCGGARDPEHEAVKRYLAGGMTEELKRRVHWERFEAMDHPDANNVRLVRGVYRVDGKAEVVDIIFRLENGKVVNHKVHLFADDWRTHVAEIEW